MKLLVKSRLFENKVGSTVLALCNVCAVYQGVCSTPGDFSTLGDIQYTGRFPRVHRRISSSTPRVFSTLWDIMSTLGVFSTVGDTMMSVGGIS